MRKLIYALLFVTAFLTACSKGGGSAPDPIDPPTTPTKDEFSIKSFSPDISPIAIGQKFNLISELSISDNPSIVYKISFTKDGSSDTRLSDNADPKYGVRIVDQGDGKADKGPGKYTFKLTVVNGDVTKSTSADVDILSPDFAGGVWGNTKGVIEESEDFINTSRQTALTGYWHDLPNTGHESLSFENAHGYNGFKYIFSDNKLIAGAGYLKYTSSTPGNSFATFDGMSKQYSDLYGKAPSINDWEWRNEPQHVIDQYTNSDDYVALAGFASVGNLSVTKVWGNDTDSTFININTPTKGFVLVSVFRKTKDAK